MAPFATMILALPALLLEGNGILEWFSIHPYPWAALIIIFSSGVLAFCLNFSIFYVIHSTTAVTFNVAGNLKVRLLLITSSIMISYWCILRNCTFFIVSNTGRAVAHIISSFLHEMRFSPLGLCFILL